MSKKQEFIKFVEEVMDTAHITEADMPENVKLYWNVLLASSLEVDKPLFTDNGKLIMKFLQDHQETPMWKARDVAEGLFISSRAVSGAMRKLVTDGFVEKVGQDPVIYSITEKGKNIDIEKGE